MPLVLPVPAANVAAIKANNDGFDRRRRRVCRYAGHGERLLERVGSNRGAVARESEARLISFSVDYLAGDHLKMPLVLAGPAADIAAIKPDHDAFGRRCRRLCRFRGVRLHNCLAGPHGSVAHCARVLCPADRKQFRQQVRDLAKRRQCRISRRDIGQFGRHGRGLEVEGGEAPCFARPLAGTGKQAPNPDWHVAEQRAECRGDVPCWPARRHKPRMCGDACRRPLPGPGRSPPGSRP